MESHWTKPYVLKTLPLETEKVACYEHEKLLLLKDKAGDPTLLKYMPQFHIVLK